MMTPGRYLRTGRERHGHSCDDVALLIDTQPHVCAHDRAEWLRLVEADRAPVTIDVGLVLCRLYGLSWPQLVDLVDERQGDAGRRAAVNG